MKGVLQSSMANLHSIQSTVRLVLCWIPSMAPPHQNEHTFWCLGEDSSTCLLWNFPCMSSFLLNIDTHFWWWWELNLGISQVPGKQSTASCRIFSPMLKGCLLTGEKAGTGNTQLNHFSLNNFRKVPWLVLFLGDSFVNGDNNTYFMEPLSDTLSYTRKW